MRYCKDCELYECSLRTPLGGCGDFVEYDPQFIHTMQKSLQDRVDCDWGWKKFRREAAKDILAGFAASRKGVCKGDVPYAIELADELIKQLKEDEK